MKSTKVFVKRSQSPQSAPKTIQVSDRKKKSSSNTHLHSNHNKKTIKQFDTYGKTTQKKKNNYLKQLLKTNNQQTNKYRIVTQPVEQKLLYLGNNNFGNSITKNGSAVIKLPTKSKIQHHHQYTQKYLKLNIRTSQNSKQKLKTGQSFHNHNHKLHQQCKNCERYKQQLQYYKKEVNKICMDKILWKSGQMHIDDVKESFFNLKNKQLQSINSLDVNSNNHRSTSQQQRHKTSTNSLQKQRHKIQYGKVQQQLFQNTDIKYQWPTQQLTYQYNDQQKLTTKLVDKELCEIKKHIFDLMNDIQSLTAIDYPKMLSLNVFKYEPFYMQSPSSQQQQLKQLLGQLRTSMEGKISDEDVVDMQMSEHNKMILRNLKNRLSHYLRENMELKIRKQVLQRSEEITRESQDYLRRVIEDVLLGYVDAIDSNQ